MLGKTVIEGSGATFENFDAIVQDLSAMSALSDKLDVVLARPVFSEVLLTIDYPRRRAFIERGALAAPNGKDILPMKRDASGNLLVCVRLMNEDAWMVLDTGHTSDGLS